jgi:hypothetical protein
MTDLFTCSIMEESIMYVIMVDVLFHEGDAARRTWPSICKEAARYVVSTTLFYYVDFYFLFFSTFITICRRHYTNDTYSLISFINVPLAIVTFNADYFPTFSL